MSTHSKSHPQSNYSVQQLIQGPQSPPYHPSKPIAIVGGALLEGNGGEPNEDFTILINGTRIVELGPTESIHIPSESIVIDAQGMSVMPGLIDSNQHVVLNPLFVTSDISLSYKAFRDRWEHNWSQMEFAAYTYQMLSLKHISRCRRAI